MKRIYHVATLAAAALLMGTLTSTATAAPIMCQDPSQNHMVLDSTQVSSCLAAGVGNINGNTNNDAWLSTGGSALGYGLASKDDASNPFNIVTTQNGSMGTWSIDPSFWAANSVGAIGFKFGTGNQPDEWFVFELANGVSSGNWQFINVFGTGGGLSHTNLYSTDQPPPQVPEPGILGLLGLGLLGMATSRRRRTV